LSSVVPSPTYKFGDFEHDSFRFELRCDDRQLKLEHIPIELLILLLEESGQVVSRQEIIERLWGKMFSLIPSTASILRFARFGRRRGRT
jgi:DNA-binding winged helix-turn-helix (wHTH) protein